MMVLVPLLVSHTVFLTWRLWVARGEVERLQRRSDECQRIIVAWERLYWMRARK
jgi:hypothetical protein